MSHIDFSATPTCARMMKSNAFMRLIGGPVGSGKTTACIFELFRRACEQSPAPDGFRYTRFAIVRQTLQQLKSTVLKDIMAWFGPVAYLKVQDNTVFIEVGDVKSEWLLIPLENVEDQRRLLSSQLTGAWLSEAIEIDVDLVPALAGRCGRYPSAGRGVPTWFGLIADTNLPPIGSPWHKFMDLETPPDWQIFIQPGGLDQHAENLNWLAQTEETIKLPIDDPARLAQGRTYYERLSRGNNPDWIKRYVHAQYGDDPSGTAVFRESFKQSFHVVDEVLPVFGHPIVVGQDFGRDPCAVLTQLDHKGRLLVLGEVVVEDMGLQQMLNVGLRPLLAHERYSGRPAVLIGDPAGASKSTLYEETSFDLIKRNGFMGFPAPTNDIDARLRSVEAFLLGQRDGGPAVIIDRQRCPMLIRALSGGYRYGKNAHGVKKPTPDKTGPGAKYTHVADAFQYACLAHHGGMNTMIQSRLVRIAPTRIKPSAAGWA